MATIDQLKASDGSGNASVATVQSTRAPAATTIVVDTVLGINATFVGSMGTPHTFIDPVTSEEITVISEATCVDFAGHVDGSNLEIDTIAPGQSDLGSAIGDIIIIKPTTQWADLLAELLEVSHKDNGELKPTGLVSPYAGSSAPSGWLICDGSAVSRTTYADLYTVTGDTYGDGNGTTTFNLPDLRSRSVVGVGAGTYGDTEPAANYNTSDIITVQSNTSLYTGRPVLFTTDGVAPTGLVDNTTYYVIRLSATTISLASSLANAVAGTVINITATGSGNHTITSSMTNNALGAVGGEETHALTIAETPAHTHNHEPVTGLYAGGATSNNSQRLSGQGNSGGGVVTDTGPTHSSTGGSTAHNILNPFLALNYIIKT
jgi:microcystin-dependent protein